MPHRCPHLPVILLLGLTFAVPGSAGDALQPGPIDTPSPEALLEPDPPPPRDFWGEAVVEAAFPMEELKSRALAAHGHPLTHRRLSHGNTARKEVALTFDDGPHPGVTEQLLAILAAHEVPATFFVVGAMAAQYPELVLAEAAAGHSIGNHTYHHINLTTASPAVVTAELLACGSVIESITGERPRLFRPPGGNYNSQVAATANDLGYTMVLWTANTGDYGAVSEETIWRKMTGRLGRGGIVLMHDGSPQTLSLLPRYLDYLKAHNYTCVTIDQMLATP